VDLIQNRLDKPNNLPDLVERARFIIIDSDDHIPFMRFSLRIAAGDKGNHQHIERLRRSIVTERAATLAQALLLEKRLNEPNPPTSLEVVSLLYQLGSNIRSVVLPHLNKILSDKLISYLNEKIGMFAGIIYHSLFELI
jgi:hypothetical protein